MTTTTTVSLAARTTSYVDRVRPGLLDWLESVRCIDPALGWGRWKYHAAMPEPWALNASGLAIRVLDNLGELDAVPAEQRRDAVDFLRGCQDPDDGLFKDPLETADRHQGPHDWEQVFGQRHSAATEALGRLGAKPSHPLPPAQFVNLEAVDGRTFTLDRIDWRNPWGHGESWSRAISAFLRRHELTAADRPDLALPVLRDAFAAFETRILDPATGMPTQRMKKADPSRALAGLFKTMKAYLHCGRPYPFAKAAVDFTLDLQHDDGEFGCRDNMCINWDSVWVLLHLDQQLNGGHRHADIAHAGQRLADRLLNHYRKPDGGFAFHGTHCMTNHHSIRLCDRPEPIGDMLGATMCLYCLQYADEWLNLL